MDKINALLNASIDMRKRINNTHDEIDVWARAMVMSLYIQPLNTHVTRRHSLLMKRRRYQLLALSRINDALDNAIIQFELELDMQ